ncbi:MAG: YciI family protein [Polyangiales bacterium]
MQYLLLIYEDELALKSRDEETRSQIFGEYRAFTKTVRDAGQYVAADALQPTSTATSVRVRDGKTITTDGPFAETKEQLGGFYLIEASNLDQAIATASRIPSARFGTIEVRPVWVMQ